VRITRAHHPLYGQRVQVARVWQDAACGKCFVVELADGSHMRLAASWASDGTDPLPPVVMSETKLSTASVLELLEAGRRLRRTCG
jgi:hypothetical protein